jgi:FAD/FMN-containing dehydrogenase
MTNLKDLKQILDLSGEVYADIASLENNSVDASIFKINPEIVISPKDKSDIQKVVRYISEMKKRGEDVSVTARAAGTCMSGGSLTSSIVLRFTDHMNKIINIKSDGDGKRGIVEVEMGAYYRDVEIETLKQNLIYPSYPASKDLCAMGGIVNNNSAGEKTLKYGKTEDYLESVEVVLSDGNVYTFKEETRDEWSRICSTDSTYYGEIHRAVDKLLRDYKDVIERNKPTVSKNSSGYYLWKVYNKERDTYNLAKLICGAQGTLGLVTKAKLGLVENQKYSRMIVMMVKDLKKVPVLVKDIMTLSPESFELYDDHTFNIAMKFWRDIARKIGGNIFALALQFIPEFLMVITGGVPKVILLTEFTSNNEEELDEMIKREFDILKNKYQHENDVSLHLVGKNEARKYWTFRRESFNLLRSKLSDMRTVPFIEDVVIHKDDFPEFFVEFEKVLDEYKLIYTIAGHVGDGNLHVIPLMKLSDEHSIETMEELSRRVYSLVMKYKGSISGEHNDGLIRTPFLNYMFDSEMLNLFVKVKNIFDPLNIFTPHKKVDCDLDYSIGGCRWIFKVKCTIFDV